MNLMTSIMLFHLCCFIAMLLGYLIKDKDNCDDGKK
jgi:hypothetical protein